MRTRWIKQLGKLRYLRLADYRLLTESMLLVGAIGMGLRLLPFPTVRRLLTRLAKPSAASPKTQLSSTDPIVWAVTVASCYIPQATCLTQALATKVLLGRRGYPTVVHIGVARSETGQFQAHAWVESKGRVVIGGLVTQYTRFPIEGHEII